MAKKLSYKEKYPLETRKAEVEKMLTRMPDRIPVICEKAMNCSLPDLEKKKFLIAEDITIGELEYVIKRYSRIPIDVQMTLFIDERKYSKETQISEINANYKSSHLDDDGILYVIYTGILPQHSAQSNSVSPSYEQN
ncbi:putative Autophagy protein Atg8 ubiquitin like [Monocercomonoides exilis]|uniref:putative Autophagy protein Atg8 ubiquitin like n=1 Tax=Monocercomonoides exilis TaxID=2049356 RepID=UPI003559B5FD|nr:putative Autophagy protein Atg8 ubiquitin like [Monocercomonoides exilis]